MFYNNIYFLLIIELQNLQKLLLFIIHYNKTVKLITHNFSF